MSLQQQSMSGIYLHIPFCKQACHYCNFHFSTSLKYKTEMVESIALELELQKDYLGGKTLQSIYFGGGTPSLLDQNDLQVLFDKIQSLHKIDKAAEITMEANPDDLSPEKLSILADSPVNRLSIGIQSFADEDLKYMNRAHNAQEASACILQAKEAGFSNITIDLIYGTPTMDDAQWKANIEQVLALDIPHISCYALTVEPKTALEHFIEKGKSQPVDEEQTARQFEYLTERLKSAGYEHYEISNFATPGSYARHNSNYWQGEYYLGVGPSAHSFNGHSRQWNVANNAKYLQKLRDKQVPFEREKLTAAQRYNEYILTALRTMWGVNFNKVPALFQKHFKAQVQTFLDNQTVAKEATTYRLTEKGKLLADNISMELFAEEED